VSGEEKEDTNRMDGDEDIKVKNTQLEMAGDAILIFQ